MDLSPEDIVGYHFKQSLRGYAIDEVDALLDRLADQVERHQAELTALREQVQHAEAQAAATRETEATLQRTLVVAQQAAERNLADASAQAEATLASATADAERVRREAEEAAARVRAEAEQTASHTVDEAQRLARREVDAARSRVEEAAQRHAEVLEGVAFHRDALRGHLAALEELSLVAAPAPARTDLVAGELPELVAGELPDPGASPATPADGDAAASVDAGSDGPPVGDERPTGSEGTSPLRVRVHDGADGPQDEPPLGSPARDGD